LESLEDEESSSSDEEMEASSKATVRRHDIIMKATHGQVSKEFRFCVQGSEPGSALRFASCRMIVSERQNVEL
jgi:hypothetical protein